MAKVWPVKLTVVSAAVHSKAVVLLFLFIFIVAPIVCVGSLFCYAVLCGLSSFAIIRELASGQ